jgi:cytidylate kinase
MNRNEKFVITINRELGTGGRSIGKKLADRLGVKFYDKAVIKALKEKFHLTTEEIEKLKAQKEGWWAEFQRRVVPFADVSNGGGNNSDSEIITTEEVFNTETEIIKGINEGESFVITGRSAFYILKNHPNHLSVLIQAPMANRVARVAAKQHISEAEARQIINKVDNMRENYVTRFTGTTRYDTRNYDLVFNADGKTEEQNADPILSYID